MNATFVSDKLKASLLQAAIEGKLTKQLPEDGDARDLLKQIEAEKQRLIKEKTIKREKPLPPITEDEIPFAIPDNWVWARLPTISYTISPKRYQIPSKNISKKGLYPVVSQSQNQIDGYTNLKNKVFNSIPIIIFGDHTKIVKLINFPFVIGADGTKIIKPIQINIKYLRYILSLNAKHILNRGYSRHFQFIKNSLIPLPPLAEQHRIVAVLETALAKIDKLKAYEIKLHEIDKAFPDKLKASLLQSAIEGKLTKQLPKDGDTRDLLKQIEAEKQRLIKEKTIKSEKPSPPITEDEIPFAIPDNWVWARLGSISIKVTDGSHNPPKNNGQGYPIISAKNIKNRMIDFSFSHRYVSEKDFIREDKRTCIRKGDVLLTIVGSIGEACVVQSNKKFTAQRSVCIIKSKVFPYYLMFVLLSCLFRRFAKKEASGTAQQGIYLNTIKKLLIPIPPLAEQHRIVEVLETELAKIDKLKKLIEM